METPEEIKERLEMLENALKSLNGVTTIVEDPDTGKILVGRSTYGEHKFMLVGGGIERSETPKQAGISEAEEETGIIINEEDLNLLGYFIQRKKGLPMVCGLLFFFHTKKFCVSEIMQKSPELTDIQFMSIEEIINRRTEFGLGYVRMIAYFAKIKKGLLQSPIEKRLSEPVECTIGNETFMI